MFLLEHEDDIIVVDCGLGFPEEDQLGVDLVLPDVGYLRKRQDRIRGLFLTHGHEDHIGAIGYHLPDLKCPVYGTKLTLGLVRTKLEEAGALGQADLREMDPDSGAPIPAGCFSVEPFRVCHSIPDAVGLGISTPAGLVVHTADFKFDPTPIDGRETDYAKLESFRQRGVRLLISDCVHVETPGETPSEAVIGATYDDIFAQASGRIFIATFASLIARIQQVIDVAARHNRRVATLGRSLAKNVEVALELGYLTDPKRVLVEPLEAMFLPDEQVVYVVTGSQGEPMSVLSRIANGDHKDITVGEGDTIIVSATPIPGNETAVYKIIDRLFKAGAEVIYGQRARVHVSGHASAGELARMVELTEPRDIVPFHGEHRHMALYRDLVAGVGVGPERVHFPEIGRVIEITDEAVTQGNRIESGYVYVDGATVGMVKDAVLRDRRSLARDGMLMVIVVVDRVTGQILAGPEISTRGFVVQKESAALLDGLCDYLRQEIGDGSHYAGEEWSYLNRQIREVAASYLHRETRRRPMVLPMVMEV
jgi:ribonuclease J